jgi:hypothetical protein
MPPATFARRALALCFGYYGAMGGDSRLWYLFGGIWLVVGVCFVAASLGVNLFADPEQLDDGPPSGCLPRSASLPPRRAERSFISRSPQPRAIGT